MAVYLGFAHALTGRGVTFYRENGYSLQINGDEDLLQRVDLEPIRYEKSLCVLLLPLNKRITARQLYDALDSYHAFPDFFVSPHPFLSVAKMEAIPMKAARSAGLLLFIFSYLFLRSCNQRSPRSPIQN